MKEKKADVLQELEKWQREHKRLKTIEEIVRNYGRLPKYAPIWGESTDCRLDLTRKVEEALPKIKKITFKRIIEGEGIGSSEVYWDNLYTDFFDYNTYSSVRFYEMMGFWMDKKIFDIYKFKIESLSFESGALGKTIEEEFREKEGDYWYGANTLVVKKHGRILLREAVLLDPYSDCPEEKIFEMISNRYKKMYNKNKN